MPVGFHLPRRARDRIAADAAIVEREVAIWAATYRMLDITPQPLDSFYFAFVNYTTLGYGDILPAQNWRLLGPITAMNGVLLFGWSAAVLYDILRTIAGVTAVRTAAVGPPR
jgi:Ion channel